MRMWRGGDDANEKYLRRPNIYLLASVLASSSVDLDPVLRSGVFLSFSVDH